MAQQFNRRLSVVLFEQGLINGIDVSEFKIVFNTVLEDAQTPNHCNIRIFNISTETSRRIIKGEFSFIKIDAGYDENIGTIFLGSIRYARVGRLDNADKYLDILAYDWDLWWGSAYVNQSILAGTSPKQRFELAIQNSTIAQPNDPNQRAFQNESILSNLTQQALQLYDEEQLSIFPDTPDLSRGKVHFGMTRDIFRQITMNYGANWVVQKGRLIIVPKDGALNIQHVIDNTTGLIGVPEILIDGIKLKILLNPNIIPTSIISLDNSRITERAPIAGISEGIRAAVTTPEIDGKGAYRVLGVTHEGDTRGPNWYSNLVCIRLNLPAGAGDTINVNTALLKRVYGPQGNYQNQDK